MQSRPGGLGSTRNSRAAGGWGGEEATAAGRGRGGRGGQEGEPSGLGGQGEGVGQEMEALAPYRGTAGWRGLGKDPVLGGRRDLRWESRAQSRGCEAGGPGRG